jgi:hypothetical protein
VHKTDQCAAYGHRRNIRSRHRDVPFSYVNVSPRAGSSSPICRRLKYPKRTGASAGVDEQGWWWSLEDAGKEARGACMCFIRQINASNHQMCFMRVRGRLSRNLRGQNAGAARKLRLMLELAALPSQGGTGWAIDSGPCPGIMLELLHVVLKS